MPFWKRFLLFSPIPLCSLLAQVGAAHFVAPPFSIEGDKYHVLNQQKDVLSRITALSPQDRASLTLAIMDELRTDEADLGIQSEEELHAVATGSSAEVVDLNEVSSRTVVVQATGERGGCSPTGNCPFWIFEKQRGGWKSLFDRAHPREAQTFIIRLTRTNGYRDLILSLHGSAYSSDLTIYHFRRGMYRAVACYEATWHSADAGNDQPLTVPRLSRCRPLSAR